MPFSPGDVHPCLCLNIFQNVPDAFAHTAIYNKNGTSFFFTPMFFSVT